MTREESYVAVTGIKLPTLGEAVWAFSRAIDKVIPDMTEETRKQLFDLAGEIAADVANGKEDLHEVQ